jgi:predicted phage terminase large subunit-like protein
MTVKAVRELSQRYPGSLAKLIEDKANGSAVIQMLQHEISGILPVNPEGGKVARAMAVSPLVEAGNVYLPHPSIAPWVNDFTEECAAFPNGAHDDQVDAMTQALLRWNMIPREPVIYVSEEEYEQYSRISIV